jgi:hypothetical protein
MEKYEERIPPENLGEKGGGE